MIVDGESFTLIEETAEGLRMRLLPPSRLTPRTMNLPSGGFIGGMRLDLGPTGRLPPPTTSAPTNLFRPTAARYRTHPARGTCCTSATRSALDRFAACWCAPGALCAAARAGCDRGWRKGVSVAALHAGFLIDMNGTGGEPFDGLDDVSLEPGIVPRLPTGYDIKFSSPQQAQQPAEFVGHQIRAIAAGLGLPSHLVGGDLRSANYSSLRAGLVAYRQRLEQDQFGVIIPQLVAPLFARVTGETAAEFYPPAQPWVCSFGAIFSAFSEKSLAFSAYLTARSSAEPISSRSGSGLPPPPRHPRAPGRACPHPAC